MSKIVFIHPQASADKSVKIWDSDMYAVLNKHRRTSIPSLAGLIFAQLTPRDRHEFRYVDDFVEAVDPDEIEADLVALTAMTSTADRAYQLAGDFRRRGVPVVIGGIHATVRPEEAALHADAVAIGMGEHLWPAILEDFENGRLQKVYDAKDYPPVTEFVSPRLDVLKAERYMTFPMLATRGCPYHCDFCSIAFSSGHHYRKKPIEQFVAEIRAYERYNTDALHGLARKDYFLVDDNLYVDREYTLALFRAMKDLHIIWHGQGTVNTASDEEVVQAMAESGCRSFNMGFESLSEESLAEMNKPRVNQAHLYRQALDNLTKHGIPVGAYFVFGFDSDDCGVFERTLAYIKENKLLMPMLSCLTPYPGTELEKRLAREGRVFYKGWDMYNNWTCLITPKRMTSIDLQAGFYWLALKVIDFKHLRKCLVEYWKHGPWPLGPAFGPFERGIALVAGLKMLRRKKQRESGWFLLWAALHPKACDIRTVFTILRTREMTLKIPGGFNPAERRRRIAAQKALPQARPMAQAQAQQAAGAQALPPPAVAGQAGQAVRQAGHGARGARGKIPA